MASESALTDVHISGVEEEEIDTVIASDVEFTGTLMFTKPLMIKGKFRGTIKSEGDLYISEKASVEAAIQAQVVSIKGRVKGDVQAKARLELHATSVLEGDILAPEVEMEAGCSFNGACRMLGKAR